MKPTEIRVLEKKLRQESKNFVYINYGKLFFYL